MKKTKKVRSRKLLMNLRVTAAEKKELKRIAGRYASGNLSQWLIASGLAFRPSKAFLKTLQKRTAQ